jgi:hypothetical protein
MSPSGVEAMLETVMPVSKSNWPLQTLFGPVVAGTVPRGVGVRPKNAVMPSGEMPVTHTRVVARQPLDGLAEKMIPG